MPGKSLIAIMALATVLASIPGASAAQNSVYVCVFEPVPTLGQGCATGVVAPRSRHKNADGTWNVEVRGTISVTGQSTCARLTTSVDHNVGTCTFAPSAANSNTQYQHVNLAPGWHTIDYEVCVWVANDVTEKCKTGKFNFFLKSSGDIAGASLNTLLQDVENLLDLPDDTDLWNDVENLLP